MPKVTIGMPVYNGENFIRDAFNSILAQTYSDWELVISDNASTDRTEQICREYAQRDHRIHWYRSAQKPRRQLELRSRVPTGIRRILQMGSA
jgi:glycosyltransferase involved in cell wall biosynthesis